jgi:hypothetical protein
VWVRIKAPLHGLEQMLMLPRRDPPLRPVVHWDLSEQFGQAVVQ